MRLPSSLSWIALALLGLAIAAAVALAASHLASQQIGIASESVSAGDSLAPPVTAARRRHAADHGKKPSEEKPTEPEQPETSEQPESSEAPPTNPPSESTEGDDGGGGGGGGEGPDD